MLFGSYPQQGESPEPIEWMVLDKDENTALLLSKYGLDCKPFNNVDTDITWRDCDLRRWLNNDFFNSAFTETERKRIVETEINTSDNIDYSTPGCGVTVDKIFCLSIDEVYYYFGANSKEKSETFNGVIIEVNRARACFPTAYAKKHGAATVASNKDLREPLHVSDDYHDWWFDNCWFWLRSPGFSLDKAADVGNRGAVNSVGSRVNGDGSTVRPALRIGL